MIFNIRINLTKLVRPGLDDMNKFSSTLIAFTLMAIAVPCFAMISFGYITKKQAKELGMVIRPTAIGAEKIHIEFEFKTEGILAGFQKETLGNRVELRIGDEKAITSTIPLKEDRSKAGKITVRFSTTRDQLAEMNIWAIQAIAGVGHVIRLSEHVDLKAVPAKE